MAKNDPDQRSKRDSAHPEAIRRRHETKLALIEHGSRPLSWLLFGLLVVFCLVLFRKPVSQLLSSAERVTIGSLGIELRQSAEAADVADKLTALAGLTDQQLQLFLVVGKKRGRIQYKGEEVTEENFARLEEAGLIASWSRDENGEFAWTVSQRAEVLHDVLRAHIFSTIRSSRARVN